MKLTLKQGQLKHYAHFLGFNMIISKLVVKNYLFFYTERLNQTYIKYIKSLLKSVQYYIHNSRISKIKISLNCDMLL